MKVHVICSNDSIESVFLGDEKDAKEVLEEHAKADYVKSCGSISYEEYRSIYYWHLHTVDLLINMKRR